MTHYKTPFKVNEASIIEVYKKERGELYEYADVRNGEVSYFEKIIKSKRVIVDRGNYAKVYKEGTKMIGSLSSNGLRLFMYISIHLGIHTDIIIFNYESVAGWCDIKRTGFYAALKELSEKNVIARRNDSLIEYFVNPNYIFNGSRLKLK